MAYKLTIGDVIEVAVKGSVQDGADKVSFAFTLRAKRLNTAQFREAFGPESQVLSRDFLLANVSGWRGQRLVLDDEGQPAAFSPEALDCLLSVVGMETICVNAYRDALIASHTPAGRAGN